MKEISNNKILLKKHTSMRLSPVHIPNQSYFRLEAFDVQKNEGKKTSVISILEREKTQRSRLSQFCWRCCRSCFPHIASRVFPGKEICLRSKKTIKF